MNTIKDTVVRFLAKRAVPYTRLAASAPDLEKDFLQMHERIKDFTMTSYERQYALYKAMEHVSLRKLEGDVVECGVWKGGSSMLAALTLLKFGDAARKLYLYDTYAGMSEPTERDNNLEGNDSIEKWESLKLEDGNAWCYAGLEEVRANLVSTGYPANNIFLVKGKVEDSIPKTIPEKIALLRLDTDWYESTRHELEQLYPRLVPGGVLIIDDYGHWQGARQAVDEYFERPDRRILLNRVDYTGRIGIKA